jgi:hypothetical protein
MNETSMSANTLGMTDPPAVSARAQAPASLRPAAKVLSRPEAMQRNGKALVVAGWAVTLIGVVLYCATTFAGGVDADMGELLTKNVVPFARATLAVMGIGTALWLAGSFVYLKGAMDADP